MHVLKKDKISYGLIIVLMLFSQNTMLFSPLVSGSRGMLRTCVYLFVLLYLLIKTMVKNRIDTYLVLGFALFAGMVFLSMLFHGDAGGKYWLIVMLISFFLIDNYDMLDFSLKYNSIMRVLCIIFLAGYIFFLIKPDFILSAAWIKLEETGGVFDHSSMLYYYQRNIVPMRAYGIFREPGVYQMYVILAMLVCLYTKKKFLLDFLIYSLSVLTTYSTTGYICLLLIYSVFLLKILSIKDRKAIIVLMGAIAAGGMAIPKIINNIIYKFTETGMYAHSWMSRYASFATNIYLWLKNPLLGVGMDGVFENFTKITQDVFGLNAGGVAITDNTNSILIFFAAYGLIPGVLFFVGIWKGIRKMEKSVLYSMIIMGMFICLFAGEQVNNTCYPYILIFWGLGGGTLQEYFINRRWNRGISII